MFCPNHKLIFSQRQVRILSPSNHLRSLIKSLFGLSHHKFTICLGKHYFNKAYIYFFDTCQEQVWTYDYHREYRVRSFGEGEGERGMTAYDFQNFPPNGMELRKFWFIKAFSKSSTGKVHHDHDHWRDPPPPDWIRWCWWIQRGCQGRVPPLPDHKIFNFMQFSE